MKFSNVLTGLFLLLVSVVYGQQSLQSSQAEYYSKYPKQAIRVADSLYQQAIQEGNSPLLIKSLILKTTFTLRIDQGDYPKMLNELEGYIDRENDTTAKCVLHSYTGELYKQYFESNLTKIASRTALGGFVPENMEEWSGNIFKEKIFGHLLASIAPQKVLQQTPVSMYQMLMEDGVSSDTLRPTLYDFLCHRAIKNLTVINLPYRPQSPMEMPMILSGIQDFIRTPIPVIALDSKSYILNIWQELLAFRLKAGDPAALLIADLERLDYVYRIYGQQDKDSLLLATLQEMKKGYTQQPIVVEIIAKEARMLTERSYMLNPLHSPMAMNQESSINKQKALVLCEEGVRRYPFYNRINLLYEIINVLKAPELSVEFPKSVYPGEELPLKISSKNIKAITVKLYRIDTNSIDYFSAQNRKDANIPQTKVSEQKYQLAESLVMLDTVLNIAVPRTGLYKITITTPGAKQDVFNDFICTQLFVTDQSNKRDLVFRVCDGISGKPVQKAKVLIYDRNFSQNRLVDSVFTNAQGIAVFARLTDKYQNYQVVNAGNPNGYIQNTPRNNDRIQNSVHTELITDRKIYRPGQTVYYKGITWKATTDTLYTLDKKTFDVSFRDANYKEVAKQTAVSNSFGSFTGSFVIPRHALNGDFTIDTDQGYAYITVADYKRPEFEITLPGQERTFHTGDMIRIKGKVSSFSGVTLADNAVSYEISRYSGFSRIPEGSNIIQGVTHTDSDGGFEIEFKAEAPSRVDQFYRSYFYQVVAKVTDSKGETQESSTRIQVYTGKISPAIEIPELVNKNQITAFHITLEDVQLNDKPRVVRYAISRLVSPTNISTTLEIHDTLIEKPILQGQLNMTRKDSIRPALQGLSSGAYLFTVDCGNGKASRIFYLFFA